MDVASAEWKGKIVALYHFEELMMSMTDPNGACSSKPSRQGTEGG